MALLHFETIGATADAGGSDLFIGPHCVVSNTGAYAALTSLSFAFTPLAA